MRYAQIRDMDIVNGQGIGVTLFVQGCHFHCKGCFNKDTWNFNGGEEWNDNIKKQFFKLIDRSYIQRVSILGGEPLADENKRDVMKLVYDIKYSFPDKKIWLYTGYKWDDAICDAQTKKASDIYRHMISRYIDVLVDGQFEIDKQDLYNEHIIWAGSTNQRIIDVQKSLQEQRIIALEE